MTIDRNVPQEEPAIMTIFFAPQDALKSTGSATGAPAATSSTSGDKAASDYTPAERTEQIPMTNRTPSEILSDLMRLTKATPVEPTPQEKEDLEMLEKMRQRTEVDSKLGLELRAKRKREEALLAQARGEVASQTE